MYKDVPKHSRHSARRQIRSLAFSSDGGRGSPQSNMQSYSEEEEEEEEEEGPT
jgi:hypothetical protein